jgi:hypothetical protein
MLIKKGNKAILIVLFFSLIKLLQVSGDVVSIGSCTDLQNIQNGLGLNYALFTDIDCTSFSWTPIGSQSTPFTGTLDGKNFTISNLNFNSASTDNAGIFGYTQQASLSNFWLQGFSITGQNYVGAVSGQSVDTNVFNVHLIGSVGTTNAITGQNYVGGLFGQFSISVAGTINYFSESGATYTNIIGVSPCGGLFGELSNSNSATLTETISQFYVTSTVSIQGVQNVGGIFGDLVAQSSSSCSITFLNGYTQANINGGTSPNQFGGFGASLNTNCDVNIQQTYVQVTWSNEPTSTGSYFYGSSSDYNFVGNNYYDSTQSTYPVVNVNLGGTGTGAPTAESTSALVTALSNFPSSIWNGASLLIEVYSTPLAACTSQSCGVGGICLASTTCYCGSNYAPINSAFSCSALSTCSPLNLTTSGTTDVNPLIYNSPLTSNFVNGDWQLGLNYQSVYNAVRNVTIFSSKDGSVCSNSIAYLTGTPGAQQTQWKQSISDVSSSCFDQISAYLPWTNVSNCLKDATNPNLFEGIVSVQTTIFTSNFSDSGFGKKNQLRDLGQTVFIQSTNVSFLFAATVTATSNSSLFLQVGYASNFTLNITGSNPNLTCFEQALGAQFNYPSNFLVFPLGVNLNQVGIAQNDSAIILESSLGNGTQIITPIKDYILVNGSISACEVTLLDVTAPSGVYQISGEYLITSYNLDAADLSLTVVLEQQLSYPFVLNATGYSLSGNTVANPTITISNPTTVNQTYVQTISIVFDLHGYNCSGFNDNLQLTVQPICSQQSTPLDCVLYTQTLAKRKVIDSFSLSAYWCPFQQRTTLNANSFLLYDGSSNTPLDQGAIVTQSRSLSAAINITIDSQVNGAVLSSANISSLTISDGVSSSVIPFNQYPQSFGNFVQNAYFMVYYNHTIDPNQFPTFNFNNNLFYVAVIDVVFAPGTKRRIEKRASLPLSYSLDSSSTSFKLVIAPISPSASPSSSPSSSPALSDNSSSSTLPIVIGGAVGGVGVLVVITIILVIVFLKKKKSYDKQHEEGTGSIEMFEQKI